MEAKSEKYSTVKKHRLFSNPSDFRYMEVYNDTQCLIPGLRTIYKLANKTEFIPLCGKVSLADWRWQRMAKLMQECFEPCETLEFQGIVRKSRKGKESKTMVMYISFNSYNVDVLEEYLVYGEVDLVGIIGGNLGLFIGFSFSGFFDQAIKLFSIYFLHNL